MDSQNNTHSLSIPFEPDFRLLSKWLKQLYENNDKNIPRLKNFLHNKFSLPDDKIEKARRIAFNILQSIANTNHGLGQYMFAQCFEKGWGCEPDPKKAFYWAQKSAETKNPWGMCALGLYYQLSIGVEENNKLGQELVEKAASTGHSHSIFNLAVIYESDDKIDPIKPFKLFEKAAFNGNAFAMGGLALCYEYGRGVEIDFKKAFVWNLKGAQNGDEDAMNNVALAYQKGLGVKNDLQKAIYWYIRSKMGGSEVGATNLEILTSALELEEDVEKQKKKIEEENFKLLNATNILRVLLIGYFKEEECIFYYQRVPFEIFRLIIEHSELIQVKGEEE